MSLPNLYKMDSKGVIRVWSISTNGANYSVSHGVDGGAQQVTNVAVKGKNTGKANATTDEEQCILEAKSLWTKQRDRKGYTEEIPTSQPNLPMLAHKYTDHAKRLKFPASVSMKLDGIRMILSVQGGGITTTSRTGTTFTGLNHIVKEYEGFDDIVIDGELYSRTLTFEQICSVVRKGDINDPRMSEVFFYAFDIINDDIYHQRVVLLDSLVANLRHTESVPWFIVKTPEEVDTRHEQFISEGYEGTMVRNINSLYKKNKRSYDLLKKKDFLDSEFEVIGYKPGKGKFEFTPIFLLRCAGGEFEAVPKGDQGLRQSYLENAESYIGSLATVRFFEYTADGIPRFPVLVNFRSDGI